MRRLLIGALLVGGCQDYDKLKKDFCTTATVAHTDQTTNKTTRAAAQFCDDFEDHTIMSGLTVSQTTGATVEAVTYEHGDDLAGDPHHAYRGRGVLHLVAPPNGSAAVVQSSVPASSPTQAIRFFLFTFDPRGTAELASFVDGSGNVIRSLSLQAGVPSIYDVATGSRFDGAFPLQPEVWTCVELDVSATLMTFSIDGNVAGGLGPLPAQAQPAAVRVGVTRSGDDAAAVDTETWIDELIVDTDPIGCGV